MTIRKSIWVAQSPETSFKVFCEEMATWWPGGFGGKDGKLFLERKVGGRFYVRNYDGIEHQIGRITDYRLPSLEGSRGARRAVTSSANSTSALRLKLA